MHPRSPLIYSHHARRYHKGFTYGGKMVPGFAHCKYNDVKSLEKMYRKMNRTPFVDWIRGRKRRVAAVMMEALQGEGGIKVGDVGFFKRARELCDENGALLMCDEVQCGMGRSGKLWGYENLDGVTPDVFTTAKALGGGIPIGALCARGKAALTFGPGEHATTYGGNPLACAAGLAVAREFCENDLMGNVERRGRQLKEGLQKIVDENSDVLKEVRGWGLLLGVEIVKEDLTAADIVGGAMEKGLLLVPAGPKVVR